MNREEISMYLRAGVAELKEASDEKEMGEILLAMTDYLLGCVQRNPRVFLEEDGLRLRKTCVRIFNIAGRLSSIYEEHEQEIKGVSERIAAGIKEDLGEVKEEKDNLTAMEEEWKKLKSENKNFVRDMEKLAEKIEEARKEKDELEAYFDENGTLKEAMAAEGCTTFKEMLEHLDEMSRQGNGLMKSYDSVLKNLMEEGERIRKRIKERQMA